MSKLNCFVAMAFGHEDTDKVYDTLIVPTLKESETRPIRIDRLEYNDDIDDKIIAELQACDFAIADLTFARPSVYFEAGYAQRKVPVIYTCRKDHFSPKASDEFGNYRVHFDLQMKNIIPWSSPSDKNFSKKLKARIEKVISPILRQKKTEQQSDIESAQFEILSTDERLKLVRDICWSRISSIGYKEVKVGELPDPLQLYLDGEIDGLTYERLKHFTPSLEELRLGIKYKKATIQSATIHVTDSLKKKFMDNVHSIIRSVIYNLNPSPRSGRISRIDDNVFICSLKRVTKESVMHILTEFRYNEEKDRYEGRIKRHIPGNGIPGFSEVYLLHTYTHGFILARNPREKFTKFSVGGDKITQYYGNKVVSRMNLMNKYINVYVISPIKSESNLREQIERTLKINKL